MQTVPPGAAGLHSGTARARASGRCSLVALLTLGLILSGRGSALAAATERSQFNPPPNILFILLDDLGWRDLGCYGSSFYETPHLDRLASQGMKFTNAYAACSVCSPTRASILTGQYPARLHLTDFLGGRPPKDAKLRI